MAAFLASDAAIPVAWLLVCLGAADLLVGWFWLKRGKGLAELERQWPRFRRVLPFIQFFDVVLIVTGGSVLHHLGAFPFPS